MVENFHGVTRYRIAICVNGGAVVMSKFTFGRDMDVSLGGQTARISA